jgi:hypothetical protein
MYVHKTPGNDVGVVQRVWRGEYGADAILYLAADESRSTTESLGNPAAGAGRSPRNRRQHGDLSFAQR